MKQKNIYLNKLQTILQNIYSNKLGNLFKYKILFYSFVYFFIILPLGSVCHFIFFYKFSCTDLGLQLGDPAPLIGLLLWTCWHFIYFANYRPHPSHRKYEQLSYPKKSENVRPHHSQSSGENSTPYSGTSPLASCKEVSPTRPLRGFGPIATIDNQPWIRNSAHSLLTAENTHETSK